MAKSRDSSELEWVGIDLHVHTPFSTDYQGNRDSSEFLAIIRNANDFGDTADPQQTSRRSKEPRKQIGCIAFTDHNSVDGFLKYRELHRRTQELRDSLRNVDPDNTYLRQLTNELDVFASVRILMGIEMKADPGIHLLLIFKEDVEPKAVVTFLEQAYETRYPDFAGKPDPCAKWTVKQTLQAIETQFGETAMVVAPHIDSSGGVYEGLKEYGQVRIAAFTHPVVRALDFNKLETRERVVEMFQQPQYQRPDIVALIQSSDYHARPGASVGQPRTEVLVPRGKATFQNIREAFGRKENVKCSIDVTQVEYRKLTENRHVERFPCHPRTMRIREEDYERFSESACAMLNSEGGILELEGTIGVEEAPQEYMPRVADQVRSILAERVQPAARLRMFRYFRLTDTKMRILFRLVRDRQLHASNSIVLVAKEGRCRRALPHEIELIVSRNIYARFGDRFKFTLDKVKENSTLLAGLPGGIPLILACQNKLRFRLPNGIEVIHKDAPVRGEGRELIGEAISETMKQFPYGDPRGNTSFVEGHPPRFEEHYLRFTAFRGSINQDKLDQLGYEKIEKPTIVVHFGGGVTLAKPGYVVSSLPMMLLHLEDSWQEHVYSLLAWMKSTFFLWYCAVRLGKRNLYFALLGPSRNLPFPRDVQSDLYRNLNRHAQNLILDEEKFIKEINRRKTRKELDLELHVRLRKRHNKAANSICLALDKDVIDFLGLSNLESQSVAEMMRDLHLTDFGFLAEQEESDS